MDQSPKQLSFQWGGSLLEMDCNFKCLTDCPLPPGQDCIYDDPDYPLDQYEYPEHTFWRWNHEDLVKPEPADPLRTRCPRCFSTAIVIGYPYIECKNCNYNEPLIDFPISQYFHLAFLQEENERQMGSRGKGSGGPRGPPGSAEELGSGLPGGNKRR